MYDYLYHTDPSKIPLFISLWGKNDEWFVTPRPGAGPTAPPSKAGRAAGLMESSLKASPTPSDESLLERYLRRTHDRKFELDL